MASSKLSGCSDTGLPALPAGLGDFFFSSPMTVYFSTGATGELSHSYPQLATFASFGHLTTSGLRPYYISQRIE